MLLSQSGLWFVASIFLFCFPGCQSLADCKFQCTPVKWLTSFKTNLFLNSTRLLKNLSMVLFGFICCSGIRLSFAVCLSKHFFDTIDNCLLWCCYPFRIICISNQSKTQGLLALILCFLLRFAVFGFETIFFFQSRIHHSHQLYLVTRVDFLFLYLLIGNSMVCLFDSKPLLSTFPSSRLSSTLPILVLWVVLVCTHYSNHLQRNDYY